MSKNRGPLAIVPTYVRADAEVGVTARTLQTLREHEPSLEVVVVDDGSPHAAGCDAICAETERLSMGYYEKDENCGFSETVNVGLREALESGRDAILINADMEFVRPFVQRMVEDKDSQDRPAAVVGGLLLYPSGQIQHGGVFFSFLNRAFDHRFRYGPGGLPEAQAHKVCPVTGALQFIRHGTLAQVGLYDETFRMGFEDVDFCLRVFDAGLECVYDPGVLAIHHESLFRGQRNERLDEWQQASLDRLHEKHAETSLGRFVPPIQ
jgi:GT2 family glycosyltransferase